DRRDFGDVNDLIESHNRFFPIESRLPMDVRRRDFALVNGKPYRREPLGASWALRLFPPDHGAAIAGRHSASGCGGEEPGQEPGL
ncbi:MAG: hypothetical protein ACE5EV_03330, partial [Gaiellales bacterium]